MYEFNYDYDYDYDYEEEYEAKHGLRLVPIGNSQNIFEHLQKLSANELKLYLVLQDMSFQEPIYREGVEGQLRYLDIIRTPLKQLYQKAKISEKTGIKSIRRLEQEKWIEIKSFDTEDGEKKRYLYIRNYVEGTYVKCNLRLDLMRILEYNPIVTKIYLYHCFMGYMYSKKGYKYKQPLVNIAKAIGVSQTHLQKIIDANKVLHDLGIITIDKEWKNIAGDMYRCENIYKFSYLPRVNG